MHTVHHIPERILRLLPGEQAIGQAKDWCARALTRFLLFAYTLFMVKPVMPILTDRLAHTFWKNLHIAVVHKVNGKEHVHYELCKEGKNLEKEKSNGKFKAEVELTFYIAATPFRLHTRQLLPVMPAKYSVFKSTLHPSFQEHDYPPPKA